MLDVPWLRVSAVMALLGSAAGWTTLLVGLSEFDGRLQGLTLERGTGVAGVTQSVARLEPQIEQLTAQLERVEEMLKRSDEADAVRSDQIEVLERDVRRLRDQRTAPEGGSQ